MVVPELKIVPAERICKICNISKPFSDFQKDANTKSGKKARCRDCCNAIGRKSYTENPKYRRIGGIQTRPDRLKRLYGVTWAHVLQTYASQHGLCANRGCGKEISLEVKGAVKNRAVIDHCHISGKFRALLCTGCNALLGQIEARENAYLGLLEYQEKHQHFKIGVI